MIFIYEGEFKILWRSENFDLFEIFISNMV